jgi:hypothetical protein
MKTNRFIIVTAILLLCTLYAGAASDFKVNGLYYRVITGTGNKVGVTSPDYPNIYKGAIIIPATVSWEGKRYQVTSIEDDVFSNNRLITSIILAEGLETIRSYAFRGTRIESIVLPNTLKEIGYAAFEASYIKSITIPASVESISDWAFTKCPYLTSVVFEGPVQSMGGNVFAGYANSPRSYTVEVKCKPFKIDNSLSYVDVKNSTLIVPYGMKGLFLAASGWKDFGTIIEKSEVSDKVPAGQKK